jgi:large subunit ribosomal protein L17
MRHARKINHLGRTNTHRHAMLSNMASSLIKHKRISTTTAKAKALRVYVEPLITRSKEDTTHSRRVVFSYLQDKDAVSELFREISPKVMNRPGGYTRILKTGFRKGDDAEMCIIELVDYNENMLAAKDAKTKSTTRRSRRAGGKNAGTAATTTKVETKVGAEDETTKTAPNEAVTSDEVETPEIVASEPESTEPESTSAEEKAEA